MNRFLTSCIFLLWSLISADLLLPKLPPTPIDFEPEYIRLDIDAALKGLNLTMSNGLRRQSARCAKKSGYICTG